MVQTLNWTSESPTCEPHRQPPRRQSPIATSSACQKPADKKRRKVRHGPAPEPVEQVAPFEAVVIETSVAETDGTDALDRTDALDLLQKAYEQLTARKHAIQIGLRKPIVHR